MSDIQHTPECSLKRGLMGVYDMCYCGCEQRLRDRIVQIEAELAEAKAQLNDFNWAWHMSPSIRSGFSTMYYEDGEESVVVECKITATPIERIRLMRNALREKVSHA
jgi:hypothetical protein